MRARERRKERENDGENPFKETFFNFSSSLITSVDGLFTFLFNLMVLFCQENIIHIYINIKWCIHVIRLLLGSSYRT